MFNTDAFLISRDKLTKNIIEHIKYPFIHCLNMFMKNSLYFKSKSIGYCLIFKDENAEKGKQCYENLLLLGEQEFNIKKKNKIGKRKHICYSI